MPESCLASSAEGREGPKPISTLQTTARPTPPLQKYQHHQVYISMCLCVRFFSITFKGFLVSSLGPTCNVMRTSPRCTHRRYGLPQVAIRPQLSCHVTLGFSRHVITVSVITLSYDIETGRSWMRWKGDDDAVILDLVPAPEGPWIILCDHGKVLHHLFGPTWLCIVSGLKPKLWEPNPWPSPTLGRVLDYKHSRRHC
jgi:hypothetical protein